MIKDDLPQRSLPREPANTRRIATCHRLSTQIPLNCNPQERHRELDIDRVLAEALTEGEVRDLQAQGGVVLGPEE